MPDSVLAQEIHYKTPDETVTFVVDFTRRLKRNAGELLTGSPTATLAGITVVSAVVNSAEEEDDDGYPIAIGKAVVVTISGGTVDTNYLLPVGCGTNLNSNIRYIVCPIYVRNS